MNILMLTPYLPYPLVSGGQIRTYNLLKNLKDKHQITLFALIKNWADKRYIQHIQPFCHKVEVFKRSQKPFTLKNILKAGFSLHPFVVTRNLVPQTIQAVEHELATRQYDLIHAETFYMMPNLPTTNIPTILVEQTIEYLGYQSYAQSSPHWYLRPAFALDIAKIKYWEKYYWKNCRRLITMSQNDRRFILNECQDIKTIDVVANGVDVDFFATKVKKLPTHPTLLFVGTFSWLPNIQAVNFLVKQLWPKIKASLPQAKLHIVGFSPTKEILSYGQLPDVSVDGGVADIRDAYSTAHVLVAPINWGKGTRYKILEAMATKTPIVATSLAVEGIAGLKHGHHVLTGTTAKQLCQQTLKVLSNPALSKRMASASYDLVRQRYNWPAISQDLDRVYQEIGHRYSQ